MKYFNLFIIFLLFPACAALAGTNHLKNEIDAFVANMSLEECVGQVLLVGLPASFEEVERYDDIKKMITELHVGGFYVTNYNYRSSSKYSHEAKINKIISFHNYLQIEAAQNKNPVPLFIAGDFETPGINSLTGIIHPPIEPLALSMVNGKLISMAGQVLATQLRTLGVNMVLGPNLDLDQQSFLSG
ncbi:hypothetical protein GTA51_15540 [Desulfovibrio aerotolerans]|uniref:beta-N-acetylhexosaminidase n=1 Tax=Solidesulfovibrio aerotolerans TaxID=295255 RepID=A0A7C9MMG1_9BACT|nr:glycoside hydrolase family 3 N-terminal domain-containing protein [Solidesulfovibrio aerotolerans]MYL84533.1 hypothetical protein [Solidesulfovibrio aerotolerans]